MPIRSNRSPLFILISGLFVVALVGGYLAYRDYSGGISRSTRVMAWIRNPSAHPEWNLTAGERCGSAPFLIPTDGFAGFLWDDSFRLGHRHQGVDIFGGGDIGVTPVLSVYAGYLTRLQEWKSTVIVRIPDDPLQPGRQIWVYYTHLADGEGNSLIAPEYPPGSTEMPVEEGTLLGYQGNYSGTPGSPVGVHLHISIVRDDGQGKFLNELEIENTLDPSPYLGLPLNAHSNEGEAPVCKD